MNLIILIPALACWMALARGSAQKALINVYLPVVLLLPQYFSLRFPHLPPLTFADAAILPLAVAMVIKAMHGWRWSWLDLWVALFALSAALSEGLNTVMANGGLQLFAEFTNIVLPYMAGKLLIEQAEIDGQPVRKLLVERMVVLLAIVAGISVYDFVTGWSSWQIVFRLSSRRTSWPKLRLNGQCRCAGDSDELPVPMPMRFWRA